ncbi:MAG TPA: ATP-binding protein [Actinomycetota bacterium]
MTRLPALSAFPAELSFEEFWKTLGGDHEHEQVELKRRVAKGLYEPMAAMAMAVGGLLILGIDDDRTLVGAALTQDARDGITRAASACDLEVQLREITVDGTPIVLVAIPEVRGRIVTTPDGRLLRRVGSSNQPLVGAAMARFVRDREEHPAEEAILATPDLSTFDLALINKALHAVGRPRVRRERIPRALIDLHVADSAEPPNDPLIRVAAAVLFAQDPRAYVAGASVKAIRREGVGPGPGPTRAREEFFGPIPKVLDSVVGFIEAHTGHHEVVVGKTRETINEYPPAALREAVLNALAHRDYGLKGATVDVTLWDDRIEIKSPGPLPGPITVENMREEHYSRNRRIMRALNDMRLVEEFGEGVDRMYLEMEARMMQPPVYNVSSSSVTVTLYNRSLISVEDQTWLALLGHLDLSAAERRLLVTAKNEGGITRRRTAELLPESDQSALLRSATARGLLTRIGTRGGSRYVLSDEVVMRAGAAGVEARSRQRQMLVDEMRRRGSISTAEGAALVDEDMAVVRHLLNDLVRSGMAVARGKTRARRYRPV